MCIIDAGIIVIATGARIVIITGRACAVTGCGVTDIGYAAAILSGGTIIIECSRLETKQAHIVRLFHIAPDDNAPA